VALTSNNRLLTFDSASPGTIIHDAAITGLAPGDALGGIASDLEGQLFGVSINGFTIDHIYVVNPASGHVSLLDGPNINLFTESGEVGVSFDPQTSLLRLVDDFGDNEVFSISGSGNGSAYALDHMAGETHFVVGDVNERFAARLGAVGYSNRFAGAASTT